VQSPGDVPEFADGLLQFARRDVDRRGNGPALGTGHQPCRCRECPGQRFGRSPRRSNAEIAAALTLSARTIGHHASAILRKLDVPTRSKAAAAGAYLVRTLSPT
jgi:hypothetical protein